MNPRYPSLWQNGPFLGDKNDDLPIKHRDLPVRYVKSPNASPARLKIC